MLNLEKIGFGWDLLDRTERKSTILLLVLGVLNSIASVLMVGSIFPFLTILVDPSVIQTNAYVSGVYQALEFTSESQFTLVLAAVTVAIILGATLIQIANIYCIEAFCSKLVHNLARRLLSLYLQQPYQFYLNAQSEKMSAQILTEVEHTVQYFIRPVAQLWSDVLTCLSIIILLTWTNPTIAGLALIILGGAYCLAFVFTQVTVRRLGRQRSEMNDARFLVTNEALAGIKEIKLSGREKRYLDRFSVSSKVMADITATIRIISAVPRFLIHALAMCGVIGICLPYIGSGELQNGENVESVLPIFGLFAFAAQRLIPNIQNIFASLTEIQFGSASVLKIRADFQLPAATQTHWDVPSDALGVKSEIKLEDISFDYEGSARSGLSDISVTIKAGERIGVVGGTGAGKTTLVDIILGLLTPQQGQILVDGTQVTPANLRAWQASVGYVPQDIFLTNASIAENIGFGIPKAELDPERIARAARNAEIEDFIEQELPEGYETTIGERGVRLSGGQRQRIGVARAFYRDADLIVFDEATSALDNVTEKAVMQSLGALDTQKTVIIIAHRLSTIEFCDRIIVMEGGRIVGLGSYDELLKDNTTLRALAAAAKSGAAE